MKITSNWILLTMRYVVKPKKRRAASSFIYSNVFKQIRGRDDITVASETMDVTVRRPKSQSQEAQLEPPAQKPQEEERPEKAA